MRNRVALATIILLLVTFTVYKMLQEGKGQSILLPEAQGPSSPRASHTATLLPDGKVLVAGGVDGTSTLRTAEIFDPTTKSFRLTGRPMTVPRMEHTATLLLDGTVLIAGGRDSGCEVTGTPCFHASAEIYDPAADNFSSVAVMKVPRARHTATRLPAAIRLEPPAGGYPPGQILIVGGLSQAQGQPLTVYRSAEVYDPTTRAFTTFSGGMMFPRAGHTAVLAGDEVFFDGGILASELWPFLVDKFSNTVPRKFTHSAIDYSLHEIHGHETVGIPGSDTLPPRRLIVAGQRGSFPVKIACRPVFAAVFTPPDVLPGQSRHDHTATLMNDGAVLLAGGSSGTEVATLTSAELVEAPCVDNTPRDAANLKVARRGHTATRLNDGAILMVGGRNESGVLRSAEIYVNTAELYEAYR